jgi:hypothetical protein
MLRTISGWTLAIHIHVWLLHRLAEHIPLCTLDQINADHKGNWYLMAQKKTDRQTAHGSEC